MVLATMTETENSGEIDAVLSVLESATKSSNKFGAIVTSAQSAYVNRLLSFNAVSYYAKPNCLSPIVCARLGWRNADKDMLACSACNAALAITLPSGLCTNLTEKLCHTFREKLALAHYQNCPFKIEGEQFLRLQNQVEDDVIPAYMTSVLPQDCVELMEQPFPSSLLRQRVKKLEQRLPPSYVYPKLEFSRDISDENDTLENIASSRLETTESIGILAILGWDPTGQQTKDSTPVVSLGCRLCYSWMELKLAKDNESSQFNDENSIIGENRPAKKTKLSRYCNPLDAHRHYCPYVCGFPESLSVPKQPIWKILVARLQKEDNGAQGAETQEKEPSMSDCDESADRIQKILRAAIARKKIDLSSDTDGDSL